MEANFNNISNFLVPLSLFSLKWRFIDPKHNILPDNDIKKLKPLNGLASQFLDQYAKTNLYSDFPFNNGLFTQIDFIDSLKIKLMKKIEFHSVFNLLLGLHSFCILL